MLLKKNLAKEIGVLIYDGLTKKGTDFTVPFFGVPAGVTAHLVLVPPTAGRTAGSHL